MSFQWPWALVALVIVPFLIWAYRRGLDRRAVSVALHPDLALLARAAGPTSGRRRHLPAVLYLTGVTLALLALARPMAPLPAPDDRTALMLSIDVSRSMMATDIEPSRIAAAQQAAREFVESLPDGARVGLVSFAGYSVLHALPSEDHARVLSAIDTLGLARGTAIGEGLAEAIRALPGRDGEVTAPASDLPPAAIILLSDGRNNRGGDPLEAAARARELGVRVFTVGLGRDDGQESPEMFGWGGFYGGFDAETLTAIAETTGGKYFEARSSAELQTVYRDLGRSLGWTVRPREVSGLLGLLAGLAVAGSLLASERLQRRIL